MMRRMFAAAFTIVFLACVAFAVTPGFVGFSSNYSTVIANGRANMYPGLAILADQRRFVCYVGGAQAETEPFVLYYTVSADGTPGNWSAPVALFTPAAGWFAQGCEVTTLASGNIVVVFWEYQNGLAANKVYTVKGTVGVGITFDAPVEIAAPVGFAQFYVGPNKIVELATNRWLLPFYGFVSSGGNFYTSGVLISENAGTTWPTVRTVIAGGTPSAYSEAAYAKIPAGYANAGRIYGIVRRDLPDDDALAGHYSVYSDDEFATVSTPFRSIALTHSTVGRPDLTFVSQGTLGGLFTIGRWSSAPRSAYAITWDRTITWAPSTFNPFGRVTGSPIATQNWYSSSAMLSNGKIAAINTSAFIVSPLTSTWIEYREFDATSPQ